MKGYRQAAVAMHGLNEHDQAWLLGELGQSERDALGNLMRELDDIGFVSTPAMNAALVEGPKATPLERVLHARAETVAMVLDREPALLVAQLLRVREWPWAVAFWSGMAGPRQAAVRAVLDTVVAAPSRDRFLVEQLANRLALHIAQPVASARQPAGLVKRLRQWIR